MSDGMEDFFDDALAFLDAPNESSAPKVARLAALDAPNEAPKAAQLDPAVAGNSSEAKRTGASKSFSVLVNQKQRGNPLLKAITSVPWEFDDIIPDYEMGKTMCALFISLRYHNMNPDYIHERLKSLGKRYDLRVLLVQVDLKDPHVPLKNLTRICLLADLTLMLAWSPEEAGKIIETYKIYENKPPDRIMEKIENDPYQKIINAVSSIKPINKTDAMTLLTTFGNLENIVKASEQRLARCPGIKERKATKLYKVLHQPFLKKNNHNVVSKNSAFDEEVNIEEVENIEKHISQE